MKPRQASDGIPVTDGGCAVSLVIPLYCEKKRLSRYTPCYLEFLDQVADSELVLVDDGSADDTFVQIQALAAQYAAVRAVKLPAHLGKGAACRAGILAACGKQILVSDCDLSTPLNEYFRLRQRLQGCDLVIGSRRMQPASIQVQPPLWRRCISWCGNRVVRRLTGLTYRDTQCGFKLLNSSRVKPLVAQTQLCGAGFDVELIWMAERAGLKVGECGVSWANRGGSRFSPWALMATLVELIRLRRRMAPIQR
ncbi:MAG: glycosyltransferase [Gammaproteobacteria bacterium]